MRYIEDDYSLRWAIAGFIGQAVRDIFNYLLIILGLSKVHVWELAADLFVSSKFAKNIGGLLVGALANYFIAGCIGIAIGLLMEWRGTKHYLLKGMFVTVGAWIGIFGLLVHSLPIFQNPPHDPLPVLLSFLGHVILGLVAAYSVVKWTD